MPRLPRLRGGATIHPGSPLATAVNRTRLAAGSVRLAIRRDATSRALGSAFRAASVGRARSDEEPWIDRIETRRGEIASGEAVRQLGLSGDAAGSGEQAVDASVLGGASGWVSLPRFWCLFLMRLVRELKPRSAIELGTAFGISTAYQAAALELNGGGTLTTFDNLPEPVAVAEHSLLELGLRERAEIKLGEIDDELEGVLERTAPIDYAFLDADHTEEATVRHYEIIARYLAPGAVVVLDDINWTGSGMGRAWERIAAGGNVSLAVGLRRMGVVVASGRNGRSTDDRGAGAE